MSVFKQQLSQTIERLQILHSDLSSYEKLSNERKVSKWIDALQDEVANLQGLISRLERRSKPRSISNR